MRITCPSCAAAYEVAPHLLAARRMVRCARCGHDWAPPEEAAPRPEPVAPLPVFPPAPARLPFRAREPAPQPELPEATITAPPAPTVPLPIPPREQEAEPPTRKRAGLAGFRAAMLVPACWAASILLLGGMAWAGYEWRGEVMRAWPPSERLYAPLGLLPPR